MTMIIHDMVRVLAMINEVGIGMKVDGDKLRFVMGMRTVIMRPSLLNVGRRPN